jgi:hypothetical protein
MLKRREPTTISTVCKIWVAMLSQGTQDKSGKLQTSDYPSREILAGK